MTSDHDHHNRSLLSQMEYGWLAVAERVIPSYTIVRPKSHAARWASYVLVALLLGVLLRRLVVQGPRSVVGS